jgi:hypothetical protein
MTESVPAPTASLFASGAPDVLGLIGLALYLGSYLALQLGLIRGDGYAYPILNLLAAAGILASLLEAFNLYAAVGEIAWIAISVVGILRLYLVRRLRLTKEEAAAVAVLAPGLARDRARRLLRLGTWVDADPGRVLAVEGRPVEALTFVAGGRCAIEVGGVPVAAIGTGGVVGEMTVLTGAPATATVVVEVPGRLLVIEAQALRSFLARNGDIQLELERTFAGDLRRKLALTTRALADHRRAVGPEKVRG